LTRITTRRALGAAAAAAALGAFLLPLTGTALAVTTPDTITSAFTPPTIGVAGTDTLAITVTDTNTSGTDSNVGFTDTLPAGLLVDSQSGESGTCGTNGVVTANPNSSTISLADGSLKGGAAGSSSATCTISVDVTSNTAGNYTNTPGAVTSSDGTGTAGAPETLTVAGEPTISGVSPANNSTFKYGQKVVVTFSCAEGEFGPGLVDCSAFDENGNDINSGGTIDTTVAGTGQQVEIDATSGDGLVFSDFIDYTVLPNNVFTVVKTSPGKNGSVKLKLKVPGAGKVVVGEKVDGKAFSSYSGKVNGAKTVTITLKPSTAGKKLLTNNAKIAKKKRPKLTGKLSIAYTPTGGKKKTASVGGIKLKS
jgi:hypothetical protein